MYMSESFEIPADFGWTCGTEMNIKIEGKDLVLVEVELLDAINRVKELHKQVPGPYDDYICDHCTDLYGDDAIPYPCPTIKAIEGK
jgi:hypothetical protein